MDSFDICTSHSDLYLLAAALRSFFLVIGTHLLAGEVDTTLSCEPTLLPRRLFWLLRYFNPVNLSWRYYSILAYRLAVARNWGETQLALVNYEAHPSKPPVPYIVTEAVHNYHVRRLEPSGFFSSQGLLTVSAGYQGALAVQYTISTAGVAFLPNITMPLAIMGLFRVMVFPWITGKVYVDPYSYPCEVGETLYKPNKWVASGWLLVLGGLLFLSFWPFFAYPAFDLPQEMLQFSIQVFYQYATVSEFVFHAALLWQGARAWGNRIVFFDHWLYKLQTLGFMGLLAWTLALGIADFVRKDYYRSCA